MCWDAEVGGSKIQGQPEQLRYLARVYSKIKKGDAGYVGQGGGPGFNSDILKIMSLVLSVQVKWLRGFGYLGKSGSVYFAQFMHYEDCK